jgi:hypothetical protein
MKAMKAMKAMKSMKATEKTIAPTVTTTKYWRTSHSGPFRNWTLTNLHKGQDWVTEVWDGTLHCVEDKPKKQAMKTMQALKGMKKHAGTLHNVEDKKKAMKTVQAMKSMKQHAGTLNNVEDMRAMKAKKQAMKTMQATKSMKSKAK